METDYRLPKTTIKYLITLRDPELVYAKVNLLKRGKKSIRWSRRRYYYNTRIVAYLVLSRVHKFFI